MVDNMFIMINVCVHAYTNVHVCLHVHMHGVPPPTHTQTLDMGT